MTCFALLLLFMSDKAGMPGYEQGWMLSDKNTLFYTWYQYGPVNKQFEIEYLMASTDTNTFKNKKWKLDGTCIAGNKIYNVFRAKNKERRQ